MCLGDLDGTEVIGAGNLWHLPLQERARLILCWMRRYTEEAQQHVAELLSSYTQVIYVYNPVHVFSVGVKLVVVKFYLYVLSC